MSSYSALQENLPQVKSHVLTYLSISTLSNKQIYRWEKFWFPGHSINWNSILFFKMNITAIKFSVVLSIKEGKAILNFDSQNYGWLGRQIKHIHKYFLNACTTGISFWIRQYSYKSQLFCVIDILGDNFRG